MSEDKKPSKQEQNLELELLKEKLKNLEAQVVKPKTTEEEFQERVARYEASQPKREALKAEIEKRRMELWAQNPKAKRDEIELIEAWMRRSDELKVSNPAHSQALKQQAEYKMQQIARDQLR